MQAAVRRFLSALFLLLVSSSLFAASAPRPGASLAPHVDVENVSGRPDSDVMLRARVARPGSGPRADSVSFFVGGAPAGNVMTSLDGLATTPFRIPGGQSLGATTIEVRVAGDPSLPGFTGDGTLTVLARPMALMTATFGQAVNVTVTSVAAVFGDHIKLEATVTKIPQNQPAPDGHVDFKVDGNDVVCGYITTDSAGKVSCKYAVGLDGPIKAGANEVTASFANWPAIQPSLDYLPAMGKGTLTVSRSAVNLSLTEGPYTTEPGRYLLHPEAHDHFGNILTLPIRFLKNGVFMQDFMTKSPGPDGIHLVGQPGSYQFVFDGNDSYTPAKSNVVTVP